MKAIPMIVQFSNPRTDVTFPNWPLGGRRGDCRFYVEHHPKKGYRVCRVTTGKPKLNTYGGKAVIVDGDNGKTYILQHVGTYDAVKISASDFMNASDIGQDSYCSAESDPPGFASLMALIK